MTNSAKICRILALWKNKEEHEKKQIIDKIIVLLQCQEASKLPRGAIHHFHLKD